MLYSLDLRERVVSYVESGGSRIAASRIFSVGERTVRRWVSLKKETGSLSPRPHKGGYPAKIDLSILKEYVDSNPNKTLGDIGKKFSVAPVSVWQALKKLDYVYKKKRFCTKNGTHRSVLNTLKK